MGEGLLFRRAGPDDWPGIWPIFQAVVRSGDTYPFLPDTDEVEARASWMQPGTDRHQTYVAEEGGVVVATAYLRPNAPGLGDHVCNAGWMVAPGAAGRGIGRRFAEHVMREAERLGFTAMQFNAVVATNRRAIALWESLGFTIVGTVPGAFRHATRGQTAIHIMHRRLGA